MSSWGLDLITLDDLTGDQRELAEIIGIEAYINLVCDWGRDSVYIGKCDRVLKRLRNERIREEYNGHNVKELARKYKLTARSINMIVAEERAALRIAPMDGQISLFEKR